MRDRNEAEPTGPGQEDLPRPPGEHTPVGARSGRELVESLLRWEDFGAVWRVLSRDGEQVTIGLYRCDAGEEVERLVSAAPELVSFLEGHRPDGPPAA